MLSGEISNQVPSVKHRTEMCGATVDGQTSRTAFRFRLDGGRDIWILLPDALSLNVTGQTVAAAMTIEASNARTLWREPVSAHAVVGEDPEAKHALVLAPFKYQFGEFDDGARL